MAAGLGFKTFTTGEVLTAGDVNGYLMQGINVFASEAARNAAITAPAEGQFAFTKDNNSLWYYDGAAWVASGATGDIEGVTAGVGISGGGTSGTVTVTNSMATAIDAKGDLVVGTGADAFSRIAVGANATVLTADSAEATGVKWATVAAGSLTLLSTTSLTGQNVTVTGISQSYANLIVLVYNVSSSASASLRCELRNSSTAQSARMAGPVGSTFESFGPDTTVYLSGNVSVVNNDPENNFLLYVNNFTSTTAKKRNLTVEGVFSNTAYATTGIFLSGCITTTSAINAVFLDLAGTATFSSGTMEIYGVN